MSHEPAEVPDRPQIRANDGVSITRRPRRKVWGDEAERSPAARWPHVLGSRRVIRIALHHLALGACMLAFVAATPPPSARKNVLGRPLASCCAAPLTGFNRDGLCRHTDQDPGMHVVCAQVTQAFLDFSRSRGNDLVTPRPGHGFPGLKPGDRWCLCASRWLEADAQQVAPPVFLEATDEAALSVVSMARLRAHAADEKPEAGGTGGSPVPPTSR